MFEVLHFLHLQDFTTSSESTLPTSQMSLGFKVLRVVEVVQDLRTLVAKGCIGNSSLVSSYRWEAHGWSDPEKLEFSVDFLGNVFIYTGALIYPKTAMLSSTHFTFTLAIWWRQCEYCPSYLEKQEVYTNIIELNYFYDFFLQPNINDPNKISKALVTASLVWFGLLPMPWPGHLGFLLMLLLMVFCGLGW